VAIPGRRRLAGFGQPVGGILADRLQEPVAGLAVALLGDDQRLVHQAPQAAQQVAAGEGAAVGDRPRRLQAEAAGEHGEPPQDDPVTLGQQVVAPLDRRRQGLVAGGDTPGTPDQQREPVVEPGRDLPRGERPQPGGGQLEGQRDPVQAPAHRPDRGLALRIEREPRPGEAGPLQEQGEGVVLAERRHLPDRLPGHAERFPAGGQHRHLGAGPEQGLRDLGRPLHDLLAVVQADQGAAVPELHRQRPQRALHGLDQHPDRRRGDLGDLGGIGDRLERDPPHAVRPPRGLVGDHAGGEPGLARATDPGQRHQPPPAHQGRHGGELGPPPDEAGEVDREGPLDRAANLATWPMFPGGRKVRLQRSTDSRGSPACGRNRS
jgi:hypothetical protein